MSATVPPFFSVVGKQVHRGVSNVLCSALASDCCSEKVKLCRQICAVRMCLQKSASELYFVPSLSIFSIQFFFECLYLLELFSVVYNVELKFIFYFKLKT